MIGSYQEYIPGTYIALPQSDNANAELQSLSLSIEDEGTTDQIRKRNFFSPNIYLAVAIAVILLSFPSYRQVQQKKKDDASLDLSSWTNTAPPMLDSLKNACPADVNWDELRQKLENAVYSNDYCTRRAAMAQASALLEGVPIEDFSEEEIVKMETDAGQLVFVPARVSICNGDRVTWINNRGGPHKVIFDEDSIPVQPEEIFLDEQPGEGEVYSTMRFNVSGTYEYYCEPYREAGMAGTIQVGGTPLSQRHPAIIESLKKTCAAATDWNNIGDYLNAVVVSDDYCTRRTAMASASGLLAGVSYHDASTPAYVAENRIVKMGTDSGMLQFVPAKVDLCKGDSVTWINNEGGPHKVFFDEDRVPYGVDVEEISMTDDDFENVSLGKYNFTMKFDVVGKYSYYCEPHRGAGMIGLVRVG